MIAKLLLIIMTFFLLTNFSSEKSNLFASSEDEPLIRFHKINENFYRGGQPTEEGYVKLKELGIDIIINFCQEKEFIQRSEKLARENGMEQRSIPWNIYGRANPKIPKEFFEIINNNDGKRIFIHCKRGVERTGVMSGLYYLKYEKLSNKEAYYKAFHGFPVKWFWSFFVKSKFDAFSKQISGDV